MTAARLQRYALMLAGYQYDIVYRKTSDHCNADGLSRLPIESSVADADVEDDAIEIFHVSQFDPLPVTAEQVRIETRRDPTLSAVYHAIQTGNFANCHHPTFTKRRDELTTHHGCILWGTRVVIPPKLQPTVLRELHSTHCGMVRMKELARSYVWWPNLNHDIEASVSSCISCQQHRHQPAKAPLHPWEWPAEPWQRIHIDFAGEFLGKMWLIVVDAHSKWPEVIPMTSTTTAKTVEHLRTIFARHGLPQQLVSDNGPQFTSEEFGDFLRRNGIAHIRTAPYHPATNGLAERFVQTFKSALKASDASLPLLSRLQNFLLIYRNTPHATTQVSPAQLLMRRPLRTRLDLLRPDTRAVVQQKQIAQAGSKPFHPARDIPLDATVMVRDYRSGHAPWIPARVTSKEGLHYRVEASPGVTWRRHVDQVRPTAVEPDMHVPPTSPATGTSPPTSPLALPLPPPEDSPEETLETSVTSPVAPPERVCPATPERRYPQRDRKPVVRLNL